MRVRQKIIIAVTGASGALYAKLLFEKIMALSGQTEETAVIFSDNAKAVWDHELEGTDHGQYPFRYFEKDDFYAPFASGSSDYSTMIVCPCSMGTLGRIAAGTSDDLIARAADVMLKERRRLILVTRETPLSLIHINNMKTLTEAGGIIVPASPSFYSKPASLEELASTITERVLDLAGLKADVFRWGGA
ncbi:MAG: UbiX family flavin prenyltransferase [Bacteroidetes bacterium]|nr:UbiX family flavin prenyltransferase [Bacteroidota bacterium]